MIVYLRQRSRCAQARYSPVSYFIAPRQRHKSSNMIAPGNVGASSPVRTDDPTLTRRVLCLLSYAGIAVRYNTTKKHQGQEKTFVDNKCNFLVEFDRIFKKQKRRAPKMSQDSLSPSQETHPQSKIKRIKLISPLKWAVLVFASFSCIFFWFPVLHVIPISFGSQIAVLLLGLVVDEMTKPLFSVAQRARFVSMAMLLGFVFFWVIERMFF